MCAAVWESPPVKQPEQDWLVRELHSNTCQCCIAKSLNTAFNNKSTEVRRDLVGTGEERLRRNSCCSDQEAAWPQH